jgi:hypothetical protein
MSAAAAASRASKRTSKKRATSLTPTTTTSKSPTKKPTLKQSSSFSSADGKVGVTDEGVAAADDVDTSTAGAAVLPGSVEKVAHLPVEASSNALEDEESVHTSMFHSARSDDDYDEHNGVDKGNDGGDDKNDADNAVNSAKQQHNLEDSAINHQPIENKEEDGHEQPPPSRRKPRSASGLALNNRGHQSTRPTNVVPNTNISLPGHPGDVLQEIKSLRKALQLPAEDADLFDLRKQQLLDQKRQQQHQNSPSGHDRFHLDSMAKNVAGGTAVAHDGSGGAPTVGAEGRAAGPDLPQDNGAGNAAVGGSSAGSASRPASRSKSAQGEHSNNRGGSSRSGVNSGRSGETSADAWTAKRLATEQSAVQAALMAASSDIPIEVCLAFFWATTLICLDLESNLIPPSFESSIEKLYHSISSPLLKKVTIFARSYFVDANLFLDFFGGESACIV